MRDCFSYYETEIRVHVNVLFYHQEDMYTARNQGNILDTYQGLPWPMCINMGDRKGYMSWYNSSLTSRFVNSTICTCTLI